MLAIGRGPASAPELHGLTVLPVEPRVAEGQEACDRGDVWNTVGSR